jgi:hypothetical protein
MMNIYSGLVAGVSILAAASAVPTSAAVVFNFSEVNASTDASLGFGSIEDDDSDSDSSSILPASALHAMATSGVTGGSGAESDHADATAAISASFAPDAASGHFIFGPNTTGVSVASPSSLNGDADSSANAVYDFTLSGPAVFSLVYTIDSSGFASGGNAPDLSFLLLDLTTFTAIEHTGPLTTSGFFTSPLEAGSYQFFVQNFDAQSSQLEAPGETSTGLNADFGFNIASIPEPNTWLMATVGFGIMGLRIRRYRRPTSLIPV